MGYGRSPKMALNVRDGGNAGFCRSKNLHAILSNCDFKLAFVVAGSDVLGSEKFGGLKLQVNDVVMREQMTLKKTGNECSGRFKGGGGYSFQSAVVVSNEILNCIDF